MKKILFPTEFASHAPEVFKYAAEIAYAFDATLVVMRVSWKVDYEYSDEEKINQDVGLLTDKLKSFVAENLPTAYSKKFPIEYIIKIGNPKEKILELALAEDIDLVVMGMTGKSNAINAIFGSTSLGVLAKAECPVLLIPPTAKSEGFDNLMYTTNFEFRDLGAINYLLKWSKKLNSPIHCIHIIERKENELKARKNMNTLKETYKDQKMLLFDMAPGDFKEKIDELAKSKKADLVMMTGHKANFLSRFLTPSSVKGVAKNISIPLLVIKDNAYELEDDGSEWISILNSIG